MSLRLGIDTGGTNTDAVLIDDATGTVEAARKSLTTHHDLALGISAALDELPSDAWPRISQIALSTTLATNTALEGLGSRVCCVLIGYDADVMRNYQIDRHVRASVIAHVAGRHNIFGDELVALDVAGLRATVNRHAHEVDAIAISSYLAPRNPDHERQAVEIARELTELPVVAGGTLSNHLDSIRRAATAILNAQLLAVTGDLLNALTDSIRTHTVLAPPVMVVRGDGTRMGVAMARSRPVEMLFSGPAASAVGGSRIANTTRGLVVDMGGTSTDIGIVDAGLPKVATHGAALAGWRTAVRAANVRSVAIGGDSRIRTDPLDLFVGPERVIPIARAGLEHPEILQQLKAMQAAALSHRLVPIWEFYASGRPLGDEVVSEVEGRVLTAVSSGPIDAHSLAKRSGTRDPRLLPVDALIARRLITRIGLTPTDLLHVTGEYTALNAEASALACSIAASESRTDIGDFVSRAHEKVVHTLSVSVLRRAIAELRPDVADSDDPLANHLLDTSAGRSSRSGPLEVDLRLNMPIIAIGAAGSAWLPEVARRLGVEVIVPPNAGVASAIGAASTGLSQELEVLIRPQYARRGITGYAVHSPENRKTFASEAQARRHAVDIGRRLATMQATAAGAQVPSVDVDEHSWIADSDEAGSPSYLMETRFRFRAIDSCRDPAESSDTTHL